MTEPRAVLQAILDAQPVDVCDIKAALELVSRPGTSPDVELRKAAELVVTNYRKWDVAVNDDDAEDFDIDDLWDAVVALGVILEGGQPIA